MSKVKSIDAKCVTSEFAKRIQIEFDEGSGTILRVGELNLKTVDYYYDDTHLLFAGMGDVHIHAREDVSGKNTYKEDFQSAHAAMINGGVCHCGDMPNNPIPPIDDRSYSDKFSLTSKTHNSLWLYAGIGPNTHPLTFKVPYKAYMGPSIGELYFRNFEELDHSLSRYANQWVSFHCEDPELLELSKNESTHFLRRPVQAEVLATKDALKLIKKYNIHGKLCHYSSGEGLKAVKEFRKEGGRVLVEVTPQHLYFSYENLSDPHSFQMNPPIRSEVDRKSLWEALNNGEIDFLATDHAPHTLEEKQKGISGLTGLDTYAGFVTWLISKNVDLKIIAKICSENPGDFYNEFQESFNALDKTHRLKRGYLKSGHIADFTILSTNEPQTIVESNLKTKVRHSPFLGETFPGKLKALFKEGLQVV